MYLRHGEKKIFHFIAPPEERKYIEVQDSDLYHTASGNFISGIDAGGRELSYNTRYVGLKEWQKLGFDENSLIADTLFTNPENGDFGIPENSPAFAIGFQEFNIK